MSAGCVPECATAEGDYGTHGHFRACPWWLIQSDARLRTAISYEQLHRECLITYDARDYAAWVTNLIRDIRERRDDRAARAAAAAAEKAVKQAQSRRR